METVWMKADTHTEKNLSGNKIQKELHYYNTFNN